MMRKLRVTFKTSCFLDKKKKCHVHQDVLVAIVPSGMPSIYFPIIISCQAEKGTFLIEQLYALNVFECIWICIYIFSVLIM